jgi:hypothetical protein
MAQVEEYLFRKQEVLSSNPSIREKKKKRFTSQSGHMEIRAVDLTLMEVSHRTPVN